MKKLLRILAIAVLAAVALTSAYACKKDKGDGALQSISFAQEPKKEYWLGEEFDMSGSITAVYERATKTVAMTDSGVSVTGYDKNAQGKQTVTVTFSEKTLQVSVNVKSRLTFSGFTSKYLVGDAFDGKGSVTVNPESGDPFRRNVTDENVTIEGFDTSAPAEVLALTVKYNDNGKIYAGTAKITVFEIESAKVTRPTKINYNSHDEAELILDGGYINLTGNNGSLKKRISLSDERVTVTGFDPSKATAENTVEPLVQQITVTYAGVEPMTFNVNVLYSGVSLVRNAAETLKAIDWSGEEAPEITEEQGEAAIQAMTYYYKLADEDKALLSEEDKLAVMRAAVVYGYEKWKAEFAQYANTFAFQFTTSGVQLGLTADDYAKVLEDVEKLKNPESPLYVEGQLLADIFTEFKDTVLYGTENQVKVGSHIILTVYAPASVFKDLLPRLEYIIGLYNDFEAIPTDWTVDTLPEYRQKIQEIFLKINASQYKESSDSAFYAVLAQWRSDVYDIIYTNYYLADLESSDPLGNIITMMNICHQMPTKMVPLFNLLNNAYNYLENAKYVANGLYDTTYVMWACFEVGEMANALAADENPMYYAVASGITYGNVSLSGISSTLYSGFFGYLYNLEADIYVKPVVDMWAEYLEIYDKYQNNNAYVDGEDFITDVKAMFASFMKLAPSEQYGFIRSLCYFYEPEQMSDGSYYAVPGYTFVYYSEDGKYSPVNFFINCISYVYEEKLLKNEADENEGTLKFFREFMTAIEANARLYTFRATGDDNIAATKKIFTDAMTAAQTYYDALGAEDKAKVDELVGEYFQEYKALVTAHSATAQATSLGEWQDELAELDRVLAKITEYAQDEFIATNEMYIAILAAFEYAQTLADNITANAPAEVKSVYYDQVIEGEGYTSTYPLDKQLAYARKLFYTQQEILSMTIGSAQYKGTYIYSSCTDIKSSLAKMYYVIEEYIAYAKDSSTEGATLREYFTDKQKVLDALKAYRDMNYYDRWVFESFDGRAKVYTNGLKKFFELYMTENAAKAANDLLAVHTAYMNFERYKNSEGLFEKYADAYKIAFTTAKTSYEALSEEDKASFDAYLADDYAFYAAVSTEPPAAEGEVEGA